MHSVFNNIKRSRLILIGYIRLWLKLLRPFSPQSILEEAEIVRLAWWFRRAFGVTSRDSLYEDTVIDPGWCVRVVRRLFHVRYTGCPVYPNEPDFYDIRLGPLGGRETSLHDLRKTKLPLWQRTSYDDPPGEVIRRHGEAVSRLIARACARKPSTLWQLLFALVTRPLLSSA